jgi:hypothetical protein
MLSPAGMAQCVEEDVMKNMMSTLKKNQFYGQFRFQIRFHPTNFVISNKVVDEYGAYSHSTPQHAYGHSGYHASWTFCRRLWHEFVTTRN